MKQRFVTGTLAGIFFLLAALWGGPFFTTVVTLLAGVGFWEFLRMKHFSLLSVPGVVGVAAILLLVPVSLSLPVEPVHVLLLLFVLLLFYTVWSQNDFTFDDAAFVFLAIFYVGFGFHYMLLIRFEDHGFRALLFVLLLIWSSDSGAYFCGSAFGKRKLLPSISPKKTVEGAVGGICAAVIVAIGFQLLFPVADGWSQSLFAAVVISVLGQFGDLIESAFKRHYGVKDSGTLLPGHGGILDRCDSWLIVLPVVYLLNVV
ncbi:MAG TPA: phosphatidate cytidylyltransferase [Bacillales bacterium]|nr:phosphatidate cytidylyltransferase [Bacillales bacterium]